jgi:predicted ribosomally synthesized peptide with SipW-like signal peptide
MGIGLLAGQQIFAAFSDTVTVQNQIATGDVHISLEEYEKKNGKEISYTDQKTVMPGDVVSKIPRITNRASACWIRAKILFQNDREDLEGLNETMLGGMSSAWKKIGEYYYYTKILTNKESVDLFTELRIPSDWSEQHENQELTLEIQAEAIQAANFTPDFEAMSPWGDQNIEQCLHEINGTVTCQKSNIELKIQFHGGAHRLLAIPDDFFSNFSSAMPGDVLTDTIELSNTTEQEAELFFSVEAEEQELLEKLGLSIFLEESKLYEGNLYAAGLSEGISLGTFSPGQQETMRFTVTVPEDFDNSYALQEASVKWNFTVTEKEEAVVTQVPEAAVPTQTGTPAVTQTISPTPTSDVTEENSDTGSQKKEETNEESGTDEQENTWVQTGDNSPILLLVIYLLLAAAVFGISLKLRKGGE